MSKGYKEELKPEDLNVLGVINIKLTYWTVIWKERKGDHFWNKKCVCTRDVGFPSGAVLKNLPANSGDAGDVGSVLGSERSPGGGNGSPLQCSCLENPMNRGAWRATVHEVAQNQTLLSLYTHKECGVMGFPRQEHWSGLLLPPPEDLPNPGIELRFLCLLHCRQILLLLSHQGVPLKHWSSIYPNPSVARNLIISEKSNNCFTLFYLFCC